MTQRKIQFRGLSKDNKEWVYGGIAFDPTGENVAIIHKQGNNLMQHTAVLPETVGQYSGILDKAEVEVFEGDILEYLDDDANYEGGINTFYNRGAVEWDEENACFYVSNRNNVVYVWDDCEIIGNIHQNKELIKQ